ncbi:MAG: UDP-N-acetylglucosamine 2-epimerase (non-hydrolyzing) [Acidobacteria bacterium]|nr:UDP-N-acetylglucosamine 2-epimerase (non-hydrolyzing) [Acidobacteriota bacterium]
MISVLTIFGTRQEAIKLAPVIAETQSRFGEIVTHTCATAQHRQMLDQVLEWFQIRPEFDLNLMDRNQELCQLAGKVLGAVSDVLDRVQPDVVLVQGDTTTAMAAALAASYRGIPVAHVEAGLRTYDSRNPFPEELNRRIISAMASIHFAPTFKAAKALRAEGIPAEAIYVTGNTVIDALRMTLARPVSVDLADSSGRRMILVTAHRRESFGGPFESICHALRRLAERNRDIQIVYPVHLNPNVRDPVARILSGHARIRLLEPLRYELFVHLMARSHLILTDSGGIQEEAPFLGKPTLVMRETTERPEAIEAGTARLVGTSESSIVESCERLLTDPLEYERMATAGSPFGDGQASRRIVDVLLGLHKPDDMFEFKEVQCAEFATC